MPMENLTILGILAGYLIVIVIVGLYGSKKIQAATGFYLADRSLGWFVVAATLSATVIGGSATIATGALIYQSGLPGIWVDIGGAVGLLILGCTLAKLVRRTKLTTLPEIVGHLFGPKVRFVAALLVIVTQIAWIALLIQGTGAILSVLLPLDYQFLLVATTLIFIAYTFVGGQYAVVYTDIIQFFVMMIGICAIATPLLFMESFPLFSQLPSQHLSFPINASIGVLPVLSFFFMMLLPHIVGPDIYSKLLSAKDERSARLGALWSGVFKFVVALAIVIIAFAAVVLYPNLENPSLAIPTAIVHLPPLIAGIVLAAFVSVMLSSADSVLLSAGTVLSVDIAHRESIMLSRIGIVAIGITALILSLHLGDIIATLKLAYTVFTAGLTLPIIFGFYKEKTRITSQGAFIGLVLGGFVSLSWLALENPFGIDAVLIGLLCSLLPLVAFRHKMGSTALSH